MLKGNNPVDTLKGSNPRRERFQDTRGSIATASGGALMASDPVDVTIDPR